MAADPEVTAPVPDCEFLKRGDFYDCATSGGGRGSPLADWCKPCLLALVKELQQERDGWERYASELSPRQS